MAKCTDQKWYYFLSGSAIAMVGGVIFLLIIRLIHFLCRRSLCKRRERVSRPSGVAGFYLIVKRKCELLTINHNIFGKTLSAVYVAACLGSFIIYIYESNDGHALEVCIRWTRSPLHIVDAAFNFFFLLHFILRFIAARDKVWMWISILSIIDHFTIIPMFMAFYMGRVWLGLRFLRAFGIVGLSNLLQAWRVLKDKDSIRLAQLVSFFAAVWLAGAGFIHLLESLGNFWSVAHPDEQHETYWTWVYFLLVTMSTVGYGDYSANTVMGRIFVVIFIITAIGMFASFVPDIASCIAAKRQALHMGAYRRQYGERHVVVCGHITPTILKTFLKDFLNKDRLVDNNLKIIILNDDPPGLEMEALIRKYLLNVIYIQGSVFNVRDLDRVKLREAAACIILTNKQSSDPVDEDAAAIMRVIAIKDFDPDIRLIVQLIQYQHKSHLLTIPNWRPKSGDKVVCLSELMLGFMAQNCLAPGFSTLLANLFTLTSYNDKKDKFHKAKSWQDLYKRSAAFEMYTSRFSDSFHGLTFREAARICYKKFDLLLLAISGPPESSGLTDIMVNPVDSKTIDAMTEGFFIAQSEADAAVVHYFCLVCHSAQEPSKVSPGSCKCEHNTSKGKRHVSPYSFSGDTKAEGRPDNGPGQGDFNRNLTEVTSRNTVLDVITEEKLDCTGLFHWIPDRPMESALITHQRARQMDFKDHVVLCLFAEDDSPLVGLCSFIMPLRASNIAYKNLKPIVIVGNTEYIQNEWTNIMNFPKLYIISKSEYGVNRNSFDGSDHLLASLSGGENTIKIGSIQSAPLCRAYLRAVNIFKCSMCVILNASKKVDGNHQSLVDKEAILCTLNIKTMPKDLSDPQQEEFPGERVMTITELVNDENVQYLEQDDDTDDCEIFMAQPYACGRVFTGTLLDSLMSTTYHNPNALAFIRAMVTGGVTSHIEQIYAEGMGLLSGEDINYRHYMYSRNRPSMAQYPIDHPLCGPHRSGCKYGDLVLYMLNTHGMLLMGLYRLLHPDEAGAFKRCVITHPPPSFTVTPQDMIFCIEPYIVKNVPKDGSAHGDSADVEIRAESAEPAAQNTADMELKTMGNGLTNETGESSQL